VKPHPEDLDAICSRKVDPSGATNASVVNKTDNIQIRPSFLKNASDSYAVGEFTVTCIKEKLNSGFTPHTLYPD
jgi:hypothetical protein